MKKIQIEMILVDRKNPNWSGKESVTICVVNDESAWEILRYKCGATPRTEQHLKMFAETYASLVTSTGIGRIKAEITAVYEVIDDDGGREGKRNEKTFYVGDDRNMER